MLFSDRLRQERATWEARRDSVQERPPCAEGSARPGLAENSEVLPRMIKLNKKPPSSVDSMVSCGLEATKRLMKNIYISPGSARTRRVEAESENSSRLVKRVSKYMYYILQVLFYFFILE